MKEEQVSLPNLSRDLFKNNTSPVETLVKTMPPMFYLERIEKGEQGGLYSYKYSGDVEQGDEIHMREVSPDTINTVAKEEKDLGFLPESKGVWICNKCNLGTIKFVEEPKLTNRVDLLYPVEGAPDHTLFPIINQAKRLLVGYLGFLQDKSIISTLVFAALTGQVLKVLTAILQKYAETIDPILEQCYLREEYLLPFTREFQKLIKIFLQEARMGELHYSLPTIIGTIFEFDDTYRYFIKDIASETTSDRLTKEPIREINRLLDLFIERLNFKQTKYTKGRVNKKVIRYAKMAKRFSYCLLYPRLRKAFKKSVSSIDWQQLQFTEADKYHMGRYDGYDYMGKSTAERFEEYCRLHNYNPPIPK